MEDLQKQIARAEALGYTAVLHQEVTIYAGGGRHVAKMDGWNNGDRVGVAEQLARWLDMQEARLALEARLRAGMLEAGNGRRAGSQG